MIIGQRAENRHRRAVAHISGPQWEADCRCDVRAIGRTSSISMTSGISRSPELLIVASSRHESLVPVSLHLDTFVLTNMFAHLRSHPSACNRGCHGTNMWSRACLESSQVDRQRRLYLTDHDFEPQTTLDPACECSTYSLTSVRKYDPPSMHVRPPRDFDELPYSLSDKLSLWQMPNRCMAAAAYLYATAGRLNMANLNSCLVSSQDVYMVVASPS